jgi:hypothetical protein
MQQLSIMLAFILILKYQTTFRTKLTHALFAPQYDTYINMRPHTRVRKKQTDLKSQKRSVFFAFQ